MCLCLHLCTYVYISVDVWVGGSLALSWFTREDAMDLVNYNANGRLMSLMACVICGVDQVYVYMIS